MNMAYAVAVAALDGAALMNQFRPERIDADDVWAFMRKIAVRHEPAFDEDGPLARGAVRMRVTFARRQLRREAAAPSARTAHRADVESRHRREVSRADGGIVGQARQREIESLG